MADEILVKRPWALVIALALTIVATTINVTSFTILLPSYIDIFHTDLLTVQWLSTGYTVSTCMAVLIVGYLADKYSAKNILLCGVIGFLGFSFFSCLVGNIYLLIGLRMLIGASAGFVAATSPSIIYQSLPREKQLVAMSAFTMASGVGVAFGPAVAGLLVEVFGWRCVYIFNIMMATIVLFPLVRLVPKIVNGVKNKLDYMSFLVGAIGTFLLLFGASYGGQWGWLSQKTLGVWAVGFLLLILFIYIEWKSEDPLLNIRVLKHTPFRNAAILYGFTQIALTLSPFVMSFYFQKVWGYTPLQAGQAIIFPGLMMAIASPIAGKFAAHIPAKPFIFWLYVALAGITYMLGQFTPETTLVYIMVWLSLRYIVIGASNPLIANCAFSLVPKEYMSHASSLNNWIGYTCTAMAVAVFTSIMNQELLHQMAMGLSEPYAMCMAVDKVTIYSMWVIVVCIPLVLLLKDRK